MRKFIFKLAVFCTIIVIFVFAVNERYVSVKSYSETDKFNCVPDGIQICNFGSSHGLNDFYYDNYEDEYVCFNFALSSQSLDYDWRIMQYYQDKIDSGAIVFITISYFSFYGIDEVSTDKFLSKNKRYYHFLPKDYIKNYDLKTDVFETVFPSLTAYENLISDMLTGSTNTKETEGAGGIDMKKYAEAAYNRHLVYEKFDEEGNRILNEEYINSLYEMVALCKEKDAIPVLVTTPYLHDYTDIVINNAPEFLDNFYSIIENIMKSQNVRYFDYGFDKRFMDSYDLFIDPDHLNRDGAIKFMEILIGDVTRKN